MSKERRTPKCIFCEEPFGNSGKEVSSSSEHILGQRRLRQYNLSQSPVSYTILDKDKKIIQELKIRGAINLKKKIVCEHCNNGWMSRLETAVDPIWDKIVISGISPEKLSISEREILAWWGLKTAIVSEYEKPVDRLNQIPQEHAQAVYEYETNKSSAWPDGVYSIFSKWPDKDDTFSGSNSLWTSFFGADVYTKKNQGIYKFGTHYRGNCLITVSTAKGGVPGLVKDKHILLYPDNKPHFVHNNLCLGDENFSPSHFNVALSMISLEPVSEISSTQIVDSPEIIFSGNTPPEEYSRCAEEITLFDLPTILFISDL